jgi:CheY-like chemotaxis protein
MSNDVDHNEVEDEKRERLGSEHSGGSSSRSSDDDTNQATNSILIIEDFAMTSKVLSASLKYCRSAVCTSCKDAVEALTMIDDHGAFDLILTDIMMQPMSGIEFIKRVRQIEAEREWKPQIILAMSADENNSQAALDAGATLFVAKYSSPMTLVMSLLDDVRKNADVVEGQPVDTKLRRGTL